MHEHHSSGQPCTHGARGHHAGFGQRGFKHPFQMGGHPHGFGGHGSRARRGDVRTAVLRLLAEQPMHGYQIIQELATRSGGAWSPSAGSVYPTLQMLADEGLVIAEEAGGKKVFRLTEEGTAAVALLANEPAPWDEAAQGDTGAASYREAAGKLMPALFQLGKSGTPEQMTAAVDILNDTRKKLYAILAED